MLLIFNMFPEFEDSGIPMTKLDIKVSRRFIRLLIDYGKSNGGGNIMDNWRKFDLKDPYYMLIDGNFTVKQGMPMEERMKFWNSLPPVYWQYKQSQDSNKDEF